MRRVVLCSGKVYYDLLTERREKAIKDVAIMRLEQMYPFPERTLGRELAPYRNAELVWCQEEPENMGAWNFVDRRSGEGAGRGRDEGAASGLCRPRCGGQPGDRFGAHASGGTGDALVATALGTA